MKRLRLLILFLSTTVGWSQELRMMFHKNYDVPRTDYEEILVEHAKKSLADAIALKSHLQPTFFIEDEGKKWKIGNPYHHLLNNLCTWKGATHLHVGLLRGESFIAALYQNQSTLKSPIGLDWFQEFPLEKFVANCAEYLTPNYEIINNDCFNLDKTVFTSPIDIYFYDADHSMKAQEKAFTYYDDLFADVFIAVVDDWKCPWIRRPTFKAFEKLGYTILHEDMVPIAETYGDNGQYVAVIRKSKRI